MSFPRIDCPRRTDNNFRMKIDSDHHKETSPLEKLPIDMVKDFPVADSLHLIDLGLMKKCLLGWINGSFNFKTKLSGADIKKMSELLINANKHCKPKEIHRAIRSLESIRFWKALEFRTFFFYLSPVILKDFLDIEVYQHFLLLFCAITICSCKTYLSYLHVADALLKSYIEKFIEIYGQDAISSNVHNLSHVVEDVENFGHLPSFSTYPFENYLSQIKRFLRTGNKPLAQIAKRLTELSKMNQRQVLEEKVFPYVSGEKSEQHQLEQCGKVFHKLFLKNGIILTSENNDKWFLTEDNEIVGMINATYYNKEIHIYGESMKNKHNFFQQPINSSYLNIYATTIERNKPKLYNLNEIKFKLVSLNYNDELVFIPLLHTIEF